jgi:hypothetical protein
MVVAHLSNLPPFFETEVPGFTVSPDGRKLLAVHTQLNESRFYTPSVTR